MFEIKNNEKNKSAVITGASSKKQKKSSLILRKAKFQAIFEFVLSSASGGAGGGKYNRISAFVSMPVLLIRRSLEKFFKKNFRDDRFCFGFAKVLAITFIFTIATTSESSAGTWDCGEIANTVSCSLENGVFTISGTGKMKDDMMTYDYIGRHDNRPWNSENIQTVVVGKGVTSIGNGAFWGASSLTSITIPEGVKSIGDSAFAYSGLTSITIPDSVTSIGNGAFDYASSLTSITIPDSVTSIGSHAFDGASSLESIIIPDNIDTENWYAYAFTPLPWNTKIVCQGDLNKCYEKLEKYLNNCPQNLKDAGKCNCEYGCIYSGLVKEATKDQCGGKYIWDETSNPKCRHMDEDECKNSAQYYINNNGQCKSMPGSKTKCKNADFLWSGSSCVKSCASGFVEWDNECLSEYPFAKKRWTPAEANQWLHDGNDNFVVITFKK